MQIILDSPCPTSLVCEVAGKEEVGENKTEDANHAVRGEPTRTRGSCTSGAN